MPSRFLGGLSGSEFKAGDCLEFGVWVVGLGLSGLGFVGLGLRVEGLGFEGLYVG